MELTKEKLTDALSLTRERVRVWVSESLSLQKSDKLHRKDRHPLPCMLKGAGEAAQNRKGRGSSNFPKAGEPVGEQERRATTKSAGSPNSRWSRTSELELRKAGS